MLLFNLLMLALPVVFLIVSVFIAVKAFEKGKSRKKTVLMQLASFAAVFAICFVCPLVAGAATEDAASASAAASGMAYIGATSEDPKAFGKAIIFVALGEGIALYGMLISIMIISSVG